MTTKETRALIAEARAAAKDKSRHSKRLLNRLASALEARQVDEATPPDAREHLHAKCDCVPDLGPAHCHLCGNTKGSPVPWTECAAVVEFLGERHKPEPVAPQPSESDRIEMTESSVVAYHEWRKALGWDRLSEDEGTAARIAFYAGWDWARAAAPAETVPKQYAPCFVNGNGTLSILGTVNKVREYAENELKMLQDNEAAYPDGNPDAIILGSRVVTPWLPVPGGKETT